MPDLTGKDRYGKMVCLFLAEGLRTRKLSLKRAADIAEKVVHHYNLLDSEDDFLRLVKELAKDFEELVVLEEKIVKSQEVGERRKLDQLIRDFAISLLPSESQTALAILQDAAAGQATLEDLQNKYPPFKQFVNSHANR